MKKNAIVIGSTGMTGSLLVDRLIQSDIYENIYIVHYRSTAHAGKPKVIERIINFDEFEDLKIDEKIDDFFCTIGTTIKTAGSPEAFRKVDLEYVKKASNWAKSKGVIQLVVISSMGATAKSGNLYLKTKGEMEDYLQESNFQKLTIVRPPLLYGEKRPDFRIGEVLGKWFMIPLGWIFKSLRPLKINELSEILFKIAQESQISQNIINPKELHQLKNQS